MNSFGKMFIVGNFGESHGRCVGATVDGCPAGVPLSEADIQPEMDRRKPSGNAASTTRKEADRVEFLSGVFNGYTTGAPICLLIWNQDANSRQYEKIRHLLRPGHADYTALTKYGGYSDYRGGGRFSGRITAGFVMAGAIALKILKIKGIELLAHTVEIGGIRSRVKAINRIRQADQDQLRCADPSASAKMVAAIEKVRAEKDSLGGIIEAIALSLPPGLGEPVFDTLESDLAKVFFAIPAVKGVEFGAGFEVARKRGSENNDAFTLKKGKIVTVTNYNGGVNGGISNGMPLVARVAVKPTPSIGRKQSTFNIKQDVNDEIEIAGRHDACIVPRAVPVVKAMMAIVLCDHARRAGIIPEVMR